MKKSQKLPEIVFARPFAVERIKTKPRTEKISASEEELVQLAQILNLDDLKKLRFECELQPWKKGGVRIVGTVFATISEICVVTLEPFQSVIEEPVDRYFLHPTKSAPQDEVIDLENIDLDEPDEIDNGSIDLGAIAIETLALTLSSHPRKPGAKFDDHIESKPQEGEPKMRKNPFDVLKTLKSD